MATSLVYRTSANELDSIVIDATLRDQHTSDAAVTEHPVESGASVVDHVRPKPRVVRLEGVIADFPLRATESGAASGTFARGATGAPAEGKLNAPSGLTRAALFGPLQLLAPSVTAEFTPGSADGPPTATFSPGTPAFGGARGRAVEVIAQLERLKDSGTVIELRSGLRDYPNMLIESLVVSRDKSTSGGVQFSAVLREIKIAESQTVPVRITRLAKAQAPQNGGKQAAKEATDAERRRSLILKLADTASAAFSKGKVE